MKNSLSNEASLYLRQHANNPVHWFSWGKEPFELAKEKDKPILISIGYSSCHWCHVMAHECFEDSYIADIMNKHFICIKVDREERPDVDQVYMEAVQMIIQRGGWPLNVFCLPDGRPFFGGTYFPPEDRGNGLVPWPQLLVRISDFYQKSRDELTENAEAIRDNLLASSASSNGSKDFNFSDLNLAAQGICGNHDDQYGGFGQAPKFPQAMVLNFLMSMRDHKETSKDLGERIDFVVGQTLKAMAHGGLFDQLGGGFSRYSVDAHWLVPHFEKMLYDNALLLESYLRGYLLNKEPLYRSVIEETVDWLDRDLLLDCGLYASALDADVDGEEGKSYVWDLETVEQILGPSLGKVFSLAYGVSQSGNFEGDMSVLALQDGDFTVRDDLKDARKVLLKFREENRNLPPRDNKVVTAWNCLLASALAEAGFYLNRKDWVAKARHIVDFIDSNLTATFTGCFSLSSVYYEDSNKRVPGFLHDYACYAQALLAVAGKVDWIEAGASSNYMNKAKACYKYIDSYFGDTDASGFYYTSKDEEAPIVRRKEWFDNATPSGNAMVLHVVSQLYALTGESDYESVLIKERSFYSQGARQHASAIACSLEAIAEADSIAVIKTNSEETIDSVRQILLKYPWRRLFVVFDPEVDFQLCLGKTCFPAGRSLEESLANYSQSI
ncbi:MAG: hypothetical protein CNB76_01685 [Puniceicoccaceae bacterium MED-G32]|nr:MAG: hypothetical protein CNB76_01685 [Puniceicoccaceae bacterium MED-G32]